MNSQFMRSQHARDRWIQATGELWDQNFHGYRLSGVQNLREFIFYYISHEVLSTEGSCEHVAPSLGGDRMVDR
jgi:hypothetical protein